VNERALAVENERLQAGAPFPVGEQIELMPETAI
jgi:hypothetical protein